MSVQRAKLALLWSASFLAACSGGTSHTPDGSMFDQLDAAFDAGAITTLPDAARDAAQALRDATADVSISPTLDAALPDATLNDAAQVSDAVILDAAATADADVMTLIDASAPVDATIIFDASTAADASIELDADVAIDASSEIDAAAEQDGSMVTCGSGYELSGTLCVDVDECTEASDTCTASQQCANEGGGYDCATVGVMAAQSSALHACALFDNGMLKCWGNNDYGQLGTGDSMTRYSPPASVIDFGAGRSVVLASLGAYHTCALLDDGVVKCWGDNTHGQRGGSTGYAFDRVGVDFGAGRTVHALSSGDVHSCALLDDGSVKCWGGNDEGQLGLGDTTRRYAPSDVVDLGASAVATAIAGGAQHTCALLSGGSVKCWGYNGFGQLGLGDNMGRLAPASTAIDLGTGRTALAISAGTYNSCALLDDHTVKCWGANGAGQVGVAPSGHVTSPSATAVNLGMSRTALSIVEGATHACALLDDHTVKCWGGNDYGQLGLGDTDRRSPPAMMPIDFGVGRTAQSISSAAYHACALLDDDTVKCWGANFSGVLGYGDTMHRAAPPTMQTVNIGGR